MCCCIPVRGSGIFNTDEMLVVNVKPDERDAMLMPMLLVLLLPPLLLLLANCTGG